MNHDSTPRRASLWITVVTIAALAAGLVAWFANWRPLARTAETPGGGAADESFAADSDERVVERALRQIPGFVDSTAIKSQWVDEVDGVDLTAMSDAEREIFVRAANGRRCTCGCGYTLAACRRFDTTCPVSLGLVEALRDSVRSGTIATTEGLRERPAAP